MDNNYYIIIIVKTKDNTKQKNKIQKIKVKNLEIKIEMLWREFSYEKVYLYSMWICS